VFSIGENLPRATLVSDVVKINVSKVHYEITDKAAGGCSKLFWIGPFTGVILTAVSPK